MIFDDIKTGNIYLYLGDLPMNRITYTGKHFIGLSLNNNDKYHINHDITDVMNMEDNIVDIVQSEDVMEHVEYHKLKDCINEIYRVL